MLQVTNLEAAYGEIKVLWGIDLLVHYGEIVAMIGTNGAGKSTFLNTCVGLHRASSGVIHFNSEDITNLKTHEIVKKGMTLSPEGRRVFASLTVYENLTIASFGANDSKALLESRELVWSLFPRLYERRTQKAGTLSGGEQQMLAIGRALISNPKMLLLDEPSLGLSPLLTDQLFEKILQINRLGTTILLVEQNAYMAMEVSIRTYVIRNGRIGLEGLSKDLINDDSIRMNYLGSTVRV